MNILRYLTYLRISWLFLNISTSQMVNIMLDNTDFPPSSCIILTPISEKKFVDFDL